MDQEIIVQLIRLYLTTYFGSVLLGFIIWIIFSGFAILSKGRKDLIRK